jgi:galactokinase
MIQEFKQTMDATLFKRCSFIVSENDRVLQTANALKANDLNVFGALLYEAHEGISKLYEVSCPESDFLVDFSKQYDAVLGARQTGGGFGGCTLNIVHKDKVEAFVKEAAKAYKEAFNIELEAFEVKPSAGTYIQN